ncbi:hypothetical protein ACWGN5_22210 [Streptomyces sp. NPDC055815]
MSDLVDRLLGVPDPAAVRPRPPSFFDPPPVPATALQWDESLGEGPDGDGHGPAGDPMAPRHGTPPARTAPEHAPVLPAGPSGGAGRGPGGPGPRSIGRPAGPAVRQPSSTEGTSPIPYPGAGTGARGTGRAAASPAHGEAASEGRRSLRRAAAPPPAGSALAAQPRTPDAGSPRSTLPSSPAGRGTGRRTAGPAAPGAASPPEETTVHITIGRLEIRSGPARPAPAAAPARRPAREPAVPLEEYLSRRSGGGR